jgi:hypothetical protein
MDKAKFFAGLRVRDSGLFGTSLSQGQVEGTVRIVEAGQARATPLRHLAYILATAYHETARTMQPVREMGGEKYLRSKPYYPWVGEGLVQVTWEVNARKFGATVPGQLLTWPIALVAIFEGMTKGMFTGRKLSDYIDGDRADYTGARRIVNGPDKASKIANHAKAFEAALRDAGYAASASVAGLPRVPADARPPQPVRVPVAAPRTASPKPGFRADSATKTEPAGTAPSTGKTAAAVGLLTMIGTAITIRWHEITAWLSSIF